MVEVMSARPFYTCVFSLIQKRTAALYAYYYRFCPSRQHRSSVCPCPSVIIPRSNSNRASPHLIPSTSPHADPHLTTSPFHLTTSLSASLTLPHPHITTSPIPIPPPAADDNRKGIAEDYSFCILKTLSQPKPHKRRLTGS